MTEFLHPTGFSWRQSGSSDAIAAEATAPIDVRRGTIRIKGSAHADFPVGLIRISMPGIWLSEAAASAPRAFPTARPDMEAELTVTRTKTSMRGVRIFLVSWVTEPPLTGTRRLP